MLYFMLAFYLYEYFFCCRNWHTEAQTTTSKSQINKLRTTLKKLNLPKSFPSELVVEAYQKPDIDKSSESFEWSLPNLDMIRKFCLAKMSWNSKKIDDDILPIIRRLNEKTVSLLCQNKSLTSNH